MNGFSDPKIVLASSLQALESDIIVWMHGYKDKADIQNLLACIWPPLHIKNKWNIFARLILSQILQVNYQTN